MANRAFVFEEEALQHRAGTRLGPVKPKYSLSSVRRKCSNMTRSNRAKSSFYRGPHHRREFYGLATPPFASSLTPGRLGYAKGDAVEILELEKASSLHLTRGKGRKRIPHSPRGQTWRSLVDQQIARAVFQSELHRGILPLPATRYPLSDMPVS
jgi:hypothetical protein